MAQLDDDLSQLTIASRAGPTSVSIRANKGQKTTVRITIEDDDEGSSSVSSVFTLCNSAIGAGVLSLPYAFRKSGKVATRFASIA